MDLFSFFSKNVGGAVVWDRSRLLLWNTSWTTMQNDWQWNCATQAMDEGLKLVVVNKKRTKKAQMIIAFLFISKNNEYVENNEQFQVRSNHGTDSGPETDM